MRQVDGDGNENSYRNHHCEEESFPAHKNYRPFLMRFRFIIATFPVLSKGIRFYF